MWVQSLGKEIRWTRAWRPNSAFLPGESPWTEEPGGLPSTGDKESDMTEVTKHMCTPWFPHLCTEDNKRTFLWVCY